MPLNPIKARFRCESVTNVAGGSQIAKLQAVREGHFDNSNYARYMEQQGTLELTVTRPEARDSFKAGRTYDLTITELSVVPPPTSS